MENNNLAYFCEWIEIKKERGRKGDRGGTVKAKRKSPG